ncbi:MULTISPECIES: HU family DNA-binding protein [Aeromonas]|uniref:HU family DNA-binding protein n=1 Tax=Aeromonas veronii TaxID=654 RepID=A0A4S5CGY8_AERVE|nr:MULTISPECIES: HU family DNA-binding protein [Aeromonas]THJ44939.1 HU family DNA-binding protein [Aeromonas veronii]
MNKQELINNIAEQADISKQDAKKALDAMLAGITEALSKREEVSLVGFGAFTVRHRAERQGRNPQTGATMTVAASDIPTFKPGKALKDAINS